MSIRSATGTLGSRELLDHSVYLAARKRTSRDGSITTSCEDSSKCPIFYYRPLELLALRLGA
ncbi:MAG: hypothetical protein HY899_19265 [Deltaproteobacteria bacterium]|nr:hypothetical protein [Deltaproteobacteria bacterium]